MKFSTKSDSELDTTTFPRLGFKTLTSASEETAAFHDTGLLMKFMSVLLIAACKQQQHVENKM